MSEIMEDALPPLSMTIELDQPIEWKGAKIERLNLRPARTGERLVAESHLRQGLHQEAMRRHYLVLLSKVTEIPEPALHLLPDYVFEEAVGYLESFLGNGRRTGRTSSPI